MADAENISGLSGVAKSGDVDLDRVIAEVARLPDGPVTSLVASALVGALIRLDPHTHLRHLRHVERLVPIADRHAPQDPQWKIVRATARALSLTVATLERRLSDPRAGLAELEELERTLSDKPGVAMAIRSAKTVVGLAHALHVGDDSTLNRLAGDFARLAEEASGIPQAAPLADFIAQSGNILGALGSGADIWGEYERLRTKLDNLPPDHPMRSVMAETDAMARPLHSMVTGTSDEPLSDEQLAALAAMAQQSDISEYERALRLSVAGGAALAVGHETNAARVDLGVEYLRQAVAASPTDDPERPFHLWSYAAALFRRKDLAGDLADVVEAERLLVEARSLAGGPHNAHWSTINEMLAHAQRQIRGDLSPRDTTLDGLRRHTYNVMLQADPAAARKAARDAVREALDAAHQCLVDGHPADAMRALDAGRGLMLYAATRLRDVTSQLEAAGEHTLAEQWRAASPNGDPAQVPAGVREDVLRVLSANAALLDPPSFAEIQRALAAMDADALVYLVSARPTAPGWAVIAPVSGPPSYIALPSLKIASEDVEGFLDALAARDVGSGSAQAAADQAEFRKRLETLCDWAWRAAIGPLLETYLARHVTVRDGRKPHLFLVPMGDLARIPWQAARRRDGTYAVQLAALSQTASARMLCDVAERAPVPPSPVGLVVGDPDPENDGVSSLAAARLEAYHIHQAFYRGGQYMGRRPDGTTSRSGGGTVAEVRRWLTSLRPGSGSTLHLACHGFVDLDAATSYLLLAPGERTGNGGPELSATELIGLMAEAPDRDIELVVLAACRTGLAINGYDEAYSLGTAFLAGGARSVLSTQWSIPDVDTSVLMYMFHHYRMADGLPVWEALRRAQEWMLDPRREPPERMPRPLRAQLDGDSDPSRVAAWAGFVHWGQ